MKIAIYVRVSTEDQAKEGYSLEVQREYFESFAKPEGFEIFKVYQDDGISGYTLVRPALKELLKDGKEKKFSEIDEEEQKSKCLRNQRFPKTAAEESISRLTDVR
jgi:site-specific DNA recombinase